MAYEHILWSESDGVATLTLNRPEARNALNTALAEALLAAGADRMLQAWGAADLRRRLVRWLAGASW